MPPASGSAGGSARAGSGADAPKPARVTGGGVVASGRRAAAPLERRSSESKVGKRLAATLAAAKEGEDAYQKALREGRLWRVVAEGAPVLLIPNGPVVAVAEQGMMGVQVGQTVVDSFGAEWLPVTLMDESVGFTPVVLRRYSAAQEEVVRCWEYVTSPGGEKGEPSMPESVPSIAPQHGRRGQPPAGEAQTGTSGRPPLNPSAQRPPARKVGAASKDSHLPINTALPLSALPSQGFLHGFHHLGQQGCDTPTGPDWNARWQELLEHPVLYEDDGAVRRWRRDLREYYKTFCDASARTVEAIVNDRFAREEALSDASGTKPLPAGSAVRPLGGVGGENTYVHNGILFEVASEVVGYGKVFKTAASAAKAVGCHVRHASVLHSTRHPLLAPVLVCAATYLGTRVLCTALLPISHSTLAFGSADGGKSLHSRCRAGELPSPYRTALDSLGEALHLKPYTVLPSVAATTTNVFGETATAPLGPVALPFPADVQVHAGGDGRVYITNPLRMLPPALPFDKRSSGGFGVRGKGYQGAGHVSRLGGPKHHRGSTDSDEAPRHGSDGNDGEPPPASACATPKLADVSKLLYRFARPEALAAFAGVGMPVCADPFSDLPHGGEQQKQLALGAACLTQFTRARLCEHVARVLSTLDLPDDFPEELIEPEGSMHHTADEADDRVEGRATRPADAAGDVATLLSPLKRPVTSSGRARCIDCEATIARRAFRFAACAKHCCRLCTGCYLARWSQEDGGGAFAPTCGGAPRDLAGMPVYPSVTMLMHHYGVNLRHLGVVYSSLSQYRAAVQHYVKIEMVARAFRQCLWAKIRKSGGSGAAAATRTCGTYLKNLFLLAPASSGGGPSPELWWREELAPAMTTKYGLHMPLPTDGIDRTLLLERVLVITGITATDAFTQLVNDGGADGRLPASVVRRVGPVMKTIAVDDATPLPPDVGFFAPEEEASVVAFWSRQLKTMPGKHAVSKHLEPLLVRDSERGA
eukprot:TRINITY_DN4741_c0_g1_i2.p1 TRINITY_DN4741_c0_g1~~TRINITY_DN4741_c0_g1_i2.p1  ORF type:complete len:986 (+),score=174.34 TRINITY_DN4741_c0_g1_i2:45-3002(+)